MCCGTNARKSSLGYRGLVTHPYFKVIYHIDEVSAIIYVVDIWDTRMDPEDLQRHINRNYSKSNIRPRLVIACDKPWS